MQGCPKLNVIRPSRTPPKAVRSAHGKWKPKCCILYIFWNKTVLSHCLKVKLKCQHFSTMAWSTSEPLQGPKCTIFAVFLSKVKALRSLFEFYPHAYRVGNIWYYSWSSKSQPTLEKIKYCVNCSKIMSKKISSKNSQKILYQLHIYGDKQNKWYLKLLPDNNCNDCA